MPQERDKLLLWLTWYKRFRIIANNSKPSIPILLLQTSNVIGFVLTCYQQDKWTA